MTTPVCATCKRPSFPEASTGLCPLCHGPFYAYPPAVPTPPSPPAPGSQPVQLPTAPASSPSSHQLRIAAVIVGGVLYGIGAFLPWLTASAAFIGTINRSGMDGRDGPGDGMFVLVLAIVTVLAGFSGLTSTRFASRSTFLMLGFAAAGLALFEWRSVTDRIAGLDTSVAALASVGAGIYVMGVGALIIIVAALTLRPAPAPAPVTWAK